jgi:hypothetical protein
MRVRPTGHDNATDLGDSETDRGPYDIVASHPKIGRIAAEVFCVSRTLWREKMAKTRVKLKKSKSIVRIVFYNEEAKPKYKPKMKRLVILGVKRASGEIVQVASTARAWDALTPGVAASQKRLRPAREP